MKIVKMKCNKCGKVWNGTDGKFICPKCASNETRVIKVIGTIKE